MVEQLQIESILVPVDGSQCSRDAATQAVRIAAAYGAEICFLHAIDDQVVSALVRHDHDDQLQDVRERLREKADAYLRDVGRLATKSNVPFKLEVLEGDPCTVICEVAQRLRVHLIVMGKLGHRGARRLLGSVTRRVIECTDTPVLVVTGPVAV